jgi:hypothetical protein
MNGSEYVCRHIGESVTIVRGIPNVTMALHEQPRAVLALECR